jgi:hypothetical protein
MRFAEVCATLSVSVISRSSLYRSMLLRLRLRLRLRQRQRIRASRWRMFYPQA